VVTGKPIAYWGSKGRTAATGLGVSTCVLELLKTQHIDPKDATVIVQGFGNVGTYNALFLQKAGAKIVGISDITGGYYNPNGIDIKAAKAYVEKHPKRILDGYTEPGLVKMSGEDILEQDCLVLSPCALEGAINDKNAGKFKCKCIVEGANGPTSPEGDAILEKRGIIVVPDFLANSGGVIGSYFEWVQDLAGFFWTEEEYNNRLVPIMKDNFKRVWDYAQEHNVKMRRAAFLVAIKRVADGLKIKGFFL
ncbi:Glu/Leu/Phe/Val family dehydrogenase, partial [Cloacibacillus evryensis]